MNITMIVSLSTKQQFALSNKKYKQLTRFKYMKIMWQLHFYVPQLAGWRLKAQSTAVVNS